MGRRADAQAAAFRAALEEMGDLFRRMQLEDGRVLSDVFTGKLDASVILPVGQTCECLTTVLFTEHPTLGGWRAGWSCERAHCPAGRPQAGVTLADLVSQPRAPIILDLQPGLKP